MHSLGWGEPNFTSTYTCTMYCVPGLQIRRTLCDDNNFFYFCTEWADILYVHLKNAMLRYFYNVQIIENFLGWFFQKSLKIVYHRYQILILFLLQSLTNLTLLKAFIHILLYFIYLDSNFNEYHQHVWSHRTSCQGTVSSFEPKWLHADWGLNWMLRTVALSRNPNYDLLNQISFTEEANICTIFKWTFFNSYFQHILSFGFV